MYRYPSGVPSPPASSPTSPHPPGLTPGGGVNRTPSQSSYFGPLAVEDQMLQPPSIQGTLQRADTAASRYTGHLPPPPPMAEYPSFPPVVDYPPQQFASPYHPDELDYPGPAGSHNPQASFYASERPVSFASSSAHPELDHDPYDPSAYTAHRTHSHLFSDKDQDAAFFDPQFTDPAKRSGWSRWVKVGATVLLLAGVITACVIGGLYAEHHLGNGETASTGSSSSSASSKLATSVITSTSGTSVIKSTVTSTPSSSFRTSGFTTSTTTGSSSTSSTSSSSNSSSSSSTDSSSFAATTTSSSSSSSSSSDSNSSAAASTTTSDNSSSSSAAPTTSSSSTDTAAATTSDVGTTQVTTSDAATTSVAAAITSAAAATTSADTSAASSTGGSGLNISI